MVVPVKALWRRGALLIFLLVVGFGATPARAEFSDDDRADIARMESYLNGIRSLQAQFVQVAENGSVAEGTFSLERPGRLRFEYTPPTPILIVGTGKTLVFYDAELGQVSRLPTDRTLLGFLSAETFAFDDSVIVEAVIREPGLLAVTVRDSKHPAEGSVTILFSDAPLRLRQWQVRDAQGKLTTIALTDLRTNLALDPELFRFVDPDPFGRVTPP